MKTNHTRQGAVVVKFPEEVEMALWIHAIKMGKKRISRDGREMLVDRTKADAVVDLVTKQLSALGHEVSSLFDVAERAESSN